MLSRQGIETLLLFALLGGAYWFGAHNEKNACLAAQAKGVQVAQKAADKESGRKEAVGAAREVSRERIRVVYRTIKEKADVYIDTHKEGDAAFTLPSSPFALPHFCGLDADGLRIWNAANSGDAAPLSGEPDYTLPAAATGEIRKPGGFGLKPHRGDGVVRAMPGSDGEAGGVRER